MEALSSWKFPFGKESKPLQTLSPERVNASRPASTLSTSPTKTIAEESDSQDPFESPRSSPTRRAKANLFGDFHPNNGTPPKSGLGFGLPQSPSLPEISALRAHVRTNSDVQGLVKRFEHLDVRDKDAESAERRKRHEAELSRAQVAREEAESDVKKLREEVRVLEKESDASRERERKLGKRLEVVMEEFGSAKESHTSQFAVYEKELRKARKEAFKSSSTVLKLQEELKSTRNSLRITQSGLDLEKQKVQRKEQERFEMEYQQIPLQEQIEKLTRRLKVAEAKNEALKTNLREEEVARVAAEGLIALPTSQDQDISLLSSPQKRVLSPLSDDKENMHVVSKKAAESREIAKQLEKEQLRRQQAEDLAEFLRMECLFRCCPCKRAARLSHEFALALDDELAAGIEKIKEGMEEILTPPKTPMEEDQMEVEQTTKAEVLSEKAVETEIEPAPEQSVLVHEPGPVLATDQDRSMTMTAEEPEMNASPDDQLREEAEQAMRDHTPTPASQDATAPSTQTIPLQPSSPVTPSYQEHETTPFRQQPMIRTVTTTTTVPMHFTPVSRPQPFLKPTFAEDTENQPPENPHDDETGVPATPTFDRAAALAAIEYRRGRAKSIANGHATPRKQMMEGVKERRDISAPALGQKGGDGAGSVKGRSGSAGRSGGRRM